MSSFLRVNAGHGSTDPGAVGTRNGKSVNERDIVYDFGGDFVNHVKNNYEVETSFGHEKPSGGDFPKYSNGNYNPSAYGTKNGVYISFHLNASSSSAKGTECWYGEQWGDTVAKLLNAVLDDVFVDRNCKYSDANGDGYEDYYIIRECGFDTICELCFISNESDLDLLYKKWDTLISKMASTLANHYGWKKKSSKTDSPKIYMELNKKCSGYYNELMTFGTGTCLVWEDANATKSTGNHLKDIMNTKFIPSRFIKTIKKNDSTWHMYEFLSSSSKKKYYYCAKITK